MGDPVSLVANLLEEFSPACPVDQITPFTKPHLLDAEVAGCGRLGPSQPQGFEAHVGQHLKSLRRIRRIHPVPERHQAPAFELSRPPLQRKGCLLVLLDAGEQVCDQERLFRPTGSRDKNGEH